MILSFPFIITNEGETYMFGICKDSKSIDTLHGSCSDVLNRHGSTFSQISRRKATRYGHNALHITRQYSAGHILLKPHP